MWLKIKVWTKVALFAVLLIYVLAFIYNNSGKDVTFWYWRKREPSMPVLMLVVFAFLTGVVGTILLRTTIKTISQITELQSRARSQRLTREVEAMKAKAATLRSASGTTTAAATDPEVASPTRDEPEV